MAADEKRLCRRWKPRKATIDVPRIRTLNCEASHHDTHTDQGTETTGIHCSPPGSLCVVLDEGREDCIRTREMIDTGEDVWATDPEDIFVRRDAKVNLCESTQAFI